MPNLPQQLPIRRSILTLPPKDKRRIDDPPDSLDKTKPTDIELPARSEDPEHPEEQPDSPPRDGDRDTTEGESEQVADERADAQQELKDLELNR